MGPKCTLHAYSAPQTPAVFEERFSSRVERGGKEGTEVEGKGGEGKERIPPAAKLHPQKQNPV